MPPVNITSLKNPKIKQALELRERQFRQESGLTLVEGYREAVCALASSVNVTALFYCPDFFQEQDCAKLIKQCSDRGGDIYEVSPSVFEKLSYGDRKEGLLMICRPVQLSLRDLPPKKVPFYVVMEGVEKPGNLGAVLRTCDGAGVDAVILAEAATDIFNPNVIRASVGTIFSLPVAMTSNQEALEFLHARGMMTVAATPTAKQNYTDMNAKVPLALVLGSEHDGLSSFWLQKADVQVKIPLKGKADSLNIAASAAVLIYEVVRQKTI